MKEGKGIYGISRDGRNAVDEFGEVIHEIKRHDTKERNEDDL